MSKRSDLKARIHALGEIRSILSAMKNLSIIEMNKVSRHLGAQNEMARAVEEAIGDFERFFVEGQEGGKTGGQPKGDSIIVLLGSERGFCGGFNEEILKRFRESDPKAGAKIIAVGRKLGSKLEGDPRVMTVIDGASAADEIAGRITELVETFDRIPGARWTVICHQDGDGHERIQEIDPFAVKTGKHGDREQYPPLVNLAPMDLYPQLLEQYLFTVLYRAFYVSFLAENRERLRHMEGALSALDRNWDQLRKRSNTLRQEEITEELELIMLSVDSSDISS